jgi:hypothetical protein
MVYRTCHSPEICHILSAFWNNICELLACPPGQMNPVMLSLLTTYESFDRFGAVSELLSRYLCLYRGDEVFEILHFHPSYDRNMIHPADKPAHGHLPPFGWLRPMLRRSGKVEQAETLGDEDMSLLNYQRRAPTPAVCIVPVDVLEAGLLPGDGVVSLDLGDGKVVQASGVTTYIQNLIDMTSEGDNMLRLSLEAEMEMAR